MANPVVTACADQTVVKIATNVTACRVLILEGAKEYYYTYRLTGAAAPAAPTNATKPRIPTTSEWFKVTDGINDFTFVAAADLYFYAVGGISGAGQVRVDA